MSAFPCINQVLVCVLATLLLNCITTCLFLFHWFVVLFKSSISILGLKLVNYASLCHEVFIVVCYNPSGIGHVVSTIWLVKKLSIFVIPCVTQINIHLFFDKYT